MFFLKELPTRRMIEGYVDRFPNSHADSIERALLLMRQASLLIRRIDTYFAAHGFSQLRFLVLIVVDREPDRDSLYAHEISQRLDVSRPVTTRTLQNLIDEELITAAPDQHDKRSKLISLTAKGHERLGNLLPGYFAEIDSFMRKRGQ